MCNRTRGRRRMRCLKLAFALSALLVAGAALAQTKWDLPSAYPPSNFHTENLVQSNASLFKAPEIKRAVQGEQAQAGELLIVNFENENPLFGIDGVPFLATSYADSMKLYKASRPALEKLLAAQGIKLL